MTNIGDFKGLRTTAYAVPDIHKAKEWYANAFETEPYFVEDYYVGFSIGGYELGLFPGERSGKVENVISYWGVDDIGRVYDELLQKGASEGEKPNDVGDGIKVAHVFDPWGNAVGIIYNPNFKLPKEKTQKQQIAEWAPFTLKKGVSEEDLRAASRVLQQGFLEHQKGFIRRELLNKGDNQWVDLVYWSTQADADAAIKNAETSEACGAYFNLMDLKSLDPGEGILHLRVADQY